MNFCCAILSLVFLQEITSGASKDTIKCYVCDSEVSADCALSDTSKLKQFERECNATTDLHTVLNAVSKDIMNSMKTLVDGMEQQFSQTGKRGKRDSNPFSMGLPNKKLDVLCSKFVHTDGSTKKKIVKRLCFAEVEKDKCKDGCHQCKKDLCNSSPSVTSPPLVLIGTICVLLFKLQQLY
ncbi:uncharacterized protein LOC111052488 [Nilaparvata lugens]|uniref:uncharacterized protein LOC111052488 n=1 Tax=Nilaparvata lugens TaxID=108931 RepID=UPI00193CF7BE|nr:uncharacterized protein LOC111052488 [Nilaparvata lugens]